LLVPTTTMPEIGITGVAFENVAREWRCKYAMDAEGTPANSTSLKACQELLMEYMPKLKALENATVSRVVCGGCGDFKVVINQPLANHDAWKNEAFKPEEEFLTRLRAISGVERVEAQEYTLETL